MSGDLNPELARRKRAGWAAYNSIKVITANTTNVTLRADTFNATVIPALCYAAETWTLTARLESKLKSTQAAIERAMLGISLSDQRNQGLHNTDIRLATGVKDALTHANRAKHAWAGHVLRRSDGRWSRETIVWCPRDIRRPRGRPPTRWADSLASRNNTCDARGRCITHWSTKALDRDTWRSCWDPHDSNRRNRKAETEADVEERVI